MTGRREAITVTAVLLVVVLVMLTASLSLGPVARRMPLVVAVPTLVLLALELARDMRRPRAGSPQRQASERVLFLWIACLLALVLLAGMAAGIPLFLLAYMRVHFRESWRASLLLSGAMAVMLGVGLQYLLGMPLHPGLVAGWLEAGR